jgi:hypothetical protein
MENFRKYNYEFGHQKGDNLLYDIIDILKSEGIVEKNLDEIYAILHNKEILEKVIKFINSNKAKARIILFQIPAIKNVDYLKELANRIDFYQKQIKSNFTEISFETLDI